MGVGDDILINFEFLFQGVNNYTLFTQDWDTIFGCGCINISKRSGRLLNVFVSVIKPYRGRKDLSVIIKKLIRKQTGK